LGCLQSRIPHSLHQSLDDPEEKHLPPLSKSLEYSKNCQRVIPYTRAFHSNIKNKSIQNQKIKIFFLSFETPFYHLSFVTDLIQD
jgi:hypothetical protein